MPEDIKTMQPAILRREIRVFISSTFRDMQEEREELVKQVFPQLRRLCESRGVTWGEVDLRWGVPDEAKAEGKVLPLCLQEIEHCRPYFIGLLGERYGWVPEEFSTELLHTQAWLAQHRGKSVTALEILHGVLENPEMEKHAFFFFRDPTYAAAHPGFTEEEPALHKKLIALKDEIRRSGFPVSEPYATPKQLGEWVLRDLTDVIQKLYPEKDIPNELDRAALDHEAYSASRRKVYIGRDEYIDRLNAHAAGDGPPLVIAGDSGGGKSALLANWSHNWSEQHPETPVLVHFIGTAPDSANWMAMLRRLLGEFKRKFGIQIEIPDQPNALHMAFANALHMVAARGMLVLALDGLNQVEDRDGAPDLVWLPPVIPANVRLVVSTLHGRPWEELKKRGWPVLTVEPLTVPERKRFIDKYFSGYGKKLDSKSKQDIVEARQTDNALFLGTLLNELRQAGTDEELHKQIRLYLEPGPVEIIQMVAASLGRGGSEEDQQRLSPELELSDLYDRILDRWEKDFGQPEPPFNVEIVRKGLGLIYASRNGLSETELLSALGSDESPLPRALWSPLFLAAGDALVNYGGLLTFAHESLRGAVWYRYMSSKSNDEKRGHWVLGEYFKTQPLSKRQLDELPWHWLLVGRWFHLAGILSKPAFLVALWKHNPSEAVLYWSHIEKNTRMRIEITYISIIRNPLQDIELAAAVAYLLENKGNLDVAFRIREILLEHCQNPEYSHITQWLMGIQASQMLIRGDLGGASDLCKRKDAICRKLGDKFGLSVSIGIQADILMQRGDWKHALDLYREKESICRALNDRYGTLSAVSGQARILSRQGDQSQAMALCKEVERVYRELGNYIGIADSLGMKASIHAQRKEFKEAMNLYEEQEKLYRELGRKVSLAFSLLEQVRTMYLSRRNTSLARAKCKEAIQLYQSLNMLAEAGYLKGLLWRLQLNPRIFSIVTIAIILCVNYGGYLLVSRHSVWWILWGPVLVVSMLNVASNLSVRFSNFSMRLQRQLIAKLIKV
jgi:tetratricopeptide (TPR) repeat protein